MSNVKEISSITIRYAKPSWGGTAGLLLAAIYGLFMAFALVHSDWSPPQERDLTRVQGRFVSNHQSRQIPYEFLTDSGQRLLLGCIPEDLVVNCLERAAVSIDSLVDQHAQIGYFQMHVPWWEARRRGWENTIVTLQMGGRSLLSFSNRSAALEESFQAHEDINRGVGVALAVVMLLVFFLAIRTAVAKLRSIGDR